MNIFHQINEALLFAQNHPEEILVWIEDNEFDFDLDFFSQNVKGDVSILMVPADVCQGDCDLGPQGEILEKELSLIDGYTQKKIYALKGQYFLSLLNDEGRIDCGLNKALRLRGVVTPTLKKNPTPALFLDRDGIIIHDSGYVHTKEEVKIYDDVTSLIKWANQKKWKVCVLTNQAGIAYGTFDIDTMESLHLYISEILFKEGAQIDRWYACPYVRSEKSRGLYNFDSVRRKPNPGLLLDACSDFSIDIKKSIMVGDKVSDVLNISGPEYLLVKRQYDLSKAQSPIFSSLAEIQTYLENKY